MKRWHWVGGISLEWTRWGLGIELSLMHWHPPELAVYALVGPLGICLGWKRWPDSWLESFKESPTLSERVDRE